MRTVVRSAVLLPTILLVAAACGPGHPTVEAPAVPDAHRDACVRIITALPADVGNQPRRDIDGGPFVAAWGDPPIVLRCGVGTPSGFGPTSLCQRANDIDWYVPEESIDDAGADVVMTTVGREPALEVSVPARYRPHSPGNVMIDLEPVITDHTVKVGSCD